ncbi:MAG: 30S ribosomal protein S4 [Candidatus Jacksonbacteria bacterium]|nr:30S ribosomal protein S4 [Candidatus Jacksonbacteria bacterium]
MGRYLGPIHKLCRREGISLCDSPKCPARGKRAYPPGQHGPKGSRRSRSLSVYGKQLRAKQRTKRMYGLLERQFGRFFALAEKMKGNTGENLLRLLERRLDNVVYRLGLSETRMQARQMVTHGHIMVNGKNVSIPSFILDFENFVALTPRAAKNAAFAERLHTLAKKPRPAWLAWDPIEHLGKVAAEPDITDLIEPLQPNMIVELYSK